MKGIKSITMDELEKVSWTSIERIGDNNSCSPTCRRDANTPARLDISATRALRINQSRPYTTESRKVMFDWLKTSKKRFLFRQNTQCYYIPAVDSIQAFKLCGCCWWLITAWRRASEHVGYIYGRLIRVW